MARSSWTRMGASTLVLSACLLGGPVEAQDQVAGGWTLPIDVWDGEQTVPLTAELLPRGWDDGCSNCFDFASVTDRLGVDYEAMQLTLLCVAGPGERADRCLGGTPVTMLAGLMEVDGVPGPDLLQAYVEARTAFSPECEYQALETDIMGEPMIYLGPPEGHSCIGGERLRVLDRGLLFAPMSADVFLLTDLVVQLTPDAPLPEPAGEGEVWISAGGVSGTYPASCRSEDARTLTIRSEIHAPQSLDALMAMLRFDADIAGPGAGVDVRRLTGTVGALEWTIDGASLALDATVPSEAAAIDAPTELHFLATISPATSGPLGISGVCYSIGG